MKADGPLATGRVDDGPSLQNGWRVWGRRRRSIHSRHYAGSFGALKRIRPLRAEIFAVRIRAHAKFPVCAVVGGVGDIAGVKFAGERGFCRAHQVSSVGHPGLSENWKQLPAGERTTRIGLALAGTPIRITRSNRRPG